VARWSVHEGVAPMKRLLQPMLVERDASGTIFIILERRDVPLAYASICCWGGLNLFGQN